MQRSPVVFIEDSSKQMKTYIISSSTDNCNTSTGNRQRVKRVVKKLNQSWSSLVLLLRQRSHMVSMEDFSKWKKGLCVTWTHVQHRGKNTLRTIWTNDEHSDPWLRQRSHSFQGRFQWLDKGLSVIWMHVQHRRNRRQWRMFLTVWPSHEHPELLLWLRQRSHNSFYGRSQWLDNSLSLIWIHVQHRWKKEESVECFEQFELVMNILTYD